MSGCGLCDPDHAKPAKATCAACGRPACASHYRVMYGVCKACATDANLARIRDGPERPRPRDFLDIKWVEE